MVTPPSTIHNLQLWQKHCRKLRALAKRILEGKESVIEGSLKMNTYRGWLHAWDDADFNIFKVVYAETTHLPLGTERTHWNPAALAQKDGEIKMVENTYPASVMEFTAKILQKYT